MKPLLAIVAFAAAVVAAPQNVASAASCTPSTVFVPVTTTVTYIPPPTSGPTNTGSEITTHSTIYSTSTLTRTVSIFPAVTSATIISSSGGPSYFYSVVSGTTDWLNGVSPSAGASLTTGTTSFYLSPVATVSTETLDSTISVYSTAAVTQTVTPPPYTSTIFDLSALSNPPTTITSTSTRTRTVEVSLADVSSHASYSGMGAAGWNSTSGTQGAAAPTDAAVTSMETPYTYTEIHYWGTGNQTTLTSTRLLTTTLHLTAPSTITYTDAVPSTAEFTSSSSSLLVGGGSAGSASLVSAAATEGSASSSSISIYTSVPSTGFPSFNTETSGVYDCGEHGNFTLNFDTLPNFVPSNQNSTDITQAPPVPNPYHHLVFSDGYVYGPSPKVPYVPSSQPKLAVFLANASGITARPRSSTMESGEVGDGPYESASAFWFNAYSAFFGCDSPDGCTMVFTGYTYSADARDEVPSYSQNATIPACPTLNSGNASCQLQRVDFPKAFRGMSGLRMQAFAGNEERMFFLDDLALGWANNTCEAGMARLEHQ
ncbi:hypothetical protein BTJ68_00343 [Hortaea werneckii EXF-2000]|uniref:DUF7371 domain-containing protein n=1 Tax=Hortaea werneckii EXF-2000 TaxID=1157616 RepID=A0A1Z5TUX5_HORWE|nr:hypothetical protein BTJ68_00343 [Hortaea werneckii EXF-2000]